MDEGWNGYGQPGEKNPCIKPEGAIDHEMPILGFMHDGNWISFITNIVNHTDTISGNGVSADWPGFFIKALQQANGRDKIILPLIGASGNINHFDTNSKMNQTSYAEAKRVGEGYGLNAAAEVSRMVP